MNTCWQFSYFWRSSQSKVRCTGDNNQWHICQTVQSQADFTLYAVRLNTEAIIAADFKTQVWLVHVHLLSVLGCRYIIIWAKTCRVIPSVIHQVKHIYWNTTLSQTLQKGEFNGDINKYVELQTRIRAPFREVSVARAHPHMCSTLNLTVGHCMWRWTIFSRMPEQRGWMSKIFKWLGCLER